MPRAALGAAILAAAAASAAGWAASGVVENRMEDRLRRVAAAAGHDWLTVRADGLRVALTGEAPDAAAAAAAREALARAAGLAEIADATRVAVPPATPLAAAPEPEAAPALTILRDAAGLTITGRAPDAASRERLVEALRRAAPATPLVVVAEAGAAAAPAGWIALETAALAAVRALEHGAVALEPGRLSVSGLPAEDGERRLDALAPALERVGATLALDLAAPEPPLAASALDLAVDPSGVARVALCAAPDAETARALDAALKPAAAGSASCAATIEGPPSEASRAWLALARTGLSALREHGGGTLRLADARASLALPAEVSSSAAEAAFAALERAAPESVAVEIATLAPAPAVDPEAVAGPAVWLRARLSPELVTLTGAAPDEATRAAVRSYAAATFGAERVHDGLSLAEANGEPGWRSATLAALDSLDRLTSGEALVYAGRISVEGVAESAVSAGAAQRALAPAEGWRGSTRITVDLPARAAATRLPPARCVEALAALVEAAPIAFAPSSAEIEVESDAVLEQLAATLRRCGGAGVEIGGHTDSQGSESYNRQLSQERAESVREALIARGAPPDSLVARGYGEDAPVADNATEEGRALNRRIAFEPLPAPDTPPEAPPAAPPAAPPEAPSEETTP